MNAKTKSRIIVSLKYTVLIVILLLFFLPIMSMLIVSLKSEADIFSYTNRLMPADPKWENYIIALTKIKYARYLLNTITISVLYMFACTLSSSMAGYAFARFPIRENKLFFGIVLSSIMIPYIITIIPFYLLIKNLSLTDRHILWLIYGLGGQPFMIYLFRQFFSTIPRSFNESALMDGAGRLQIFFRIMLPLVKSGTIITAIFAFQWTWQNYIMPSLFLSSTKTTLAVKLNSAYVDIQQNILFGPLMAGVLYYVLVPVAVYFIFQRQIMSGLLQGGLKG